MFYVLTHLVIILLRQRCNRREERLVVHPQCALWCHPQVANGVPIRELSLVNCLVLNDLVYGLTVVQAHVFQPWVVDFFVITKLLLHIQIHFIIYFFAIFYRFYLSKIWINFFLFFLLLISFLVYLINLVILVSSINRISNI